MRHSELPFRESISSLETERLLIRIDPEEAYVNKFRSSTDEELKTFFGIATEEELLLQKKKVEEGMSTYRSSVVFFHLIEKTSAKVIGNFAYHNWYPVHRRSEIGYAMLEPYKNQGFMREAVPAIIAYGFEVIDLNRMEAFIHPDNIASRRLVERNGFKLEGQLLERYINDGIIGDSMVYRLLLSERVV